MWELGSRVRASIVLVGGKVVARSVSWVAEVERLLTTGPLGQDVIIL